MAYVAARVRVCFVAPLIFRCHRYLPTSISTDLMRATLWDICGEAYLQAVLEGKDLVIYGPEGEEIRVLRHGDDGPTVVQG